MTFVLCLVMAWIPVCGSFFQGFYAGEVIGAALNEATGSTANEAVSSDPPLR